MIIFNYLGKTINFINKVIAVVGISGGVALAFVNVIARYMFNYSLTWAAELTVYLFLWSIFFASAYLFKIDGHISIDVFLQKMEKTTAKKFLFLIKSITFIFLSAIAYYGYEYLLLVIELEETSVDLEIAMWIPYLVIPVSFAFGAYNIVFNTIDLYNTPAQNIAFHSEEDDLIQEQKTKDMLKEVEKKTGGML